jgi:hypothetical protein
MPIRRSVTGHNSAQKSVFLSDAAPLKAVDFKHVPGLKAALLWETEPGAQVPREVIDPTPAATSWVPAPGSTNAMVIVFPPDSVMRSPGFDPASAGREYLQTLPGLAETFEPDAPGMHKTNSIDYGVVLDGEICLELDDAQERQLQKHDVVVQNGNRHAWRNRSDKPATVLFVLIGAERAA